MFDFLVHYSCSLSGLKVFTLSDCPSVLVFACLFCDLSTITYIKPNSIEKFTIISYKSSLTLVMCIVIALSSKPVEFFSSRD